MIRRLIVALGLLVLIGACARIPVVAGGPPDPVEIPADAADQPTPDDALEPDADFPKPHPRFAAHFTDPLYVDRGNEFAPFGSDGGSDTLSEWIDRRDELTSMTTVRWMLGEGGGPGGILDDPADNGPDVDGFIIGAGFALILLTGHIDCEGRQLVIDALRRIYVHDPDDKPREPAVMIRDLRGFPGGECRT